MKGFFPVDDNVLVNVSNIHSIEQREEGGEQKLYVLTGSKEYTVSRDIKAFLDMVHNVGESDTYWAGK